VVVAEIALNSIRRTLRTAARAALDHVPLLAYGKWESDFASVAFGLEYVGSLHHHCFESAIHGREHLVGFNGKLGGHGPHHVLSWEPILSLTVATAIAFFWVCGIHLLSFFFSKTRNTHRTLLQAGTGSNRSRALTNSWGAFDAHWRVINDDY
jgi:hypothetical protein